MTHPHFYFIILSALAKRHILCTFVWTFNFRFMARYLFSYDLHTQPQKYADKKGELIGKLEEFKFKVTDLEVASTFILSREESIGNALKETFENLLKDTKISCAVAEICGQEVIRKVPNEEIAKEEVDLAQRIESLYK